MTRKKFCIVTVLMVALLLVGCGNKESTSESWVDFSHFQERFDHMPHSIAHEFWETNPSTDTNTVYSTIVWCNNQSRHSLEITTNSNGKILGIALQSTEENCCIPCFAEAAYHVFGSMGFNDEDGKGRIVFSGSVDVFYDYFQFFSYAAADKSMWINNHEVCYTYLPENGTYSFTISYHAQSASATK